MFKQILLIGVLFFTPAIVLAQSSQSNPLRGGELPPEISGEPRALQEVLAGASGLIFGFGAGHAIAGDYFPIGVLFTAIDVPLTGLGIFILDQFFQSCSEDGESECYSQIGLGILGVAIGVNLAISHLIQAVWAPIATRRMNAKRQQNWSVSVGAQEDGASAFFSVRF